MSQTQSVTFALFPPIVTQPSHSDFYRRYDKGRIQFAKLRKTEPKRPPYNAAGHVQ